MTLTKHLVSLIIVASTKNGVPMKFILGWIVFLCFQAAQAATQQACLDGSVSACKEIFNDYGRTTNRNGAVEFFAKVCASEKLKLQCQVMSASPSETIKKALELHKADSSSFIIDGLTLSKIYQIDPVK